MEEEEVMSVEKDAGERGREVKSVKHGKQGGSWGNMM